VSSPGVWCAAIEKAGVFTSGLPTEGSQHHMARRKRLAAVCDLSLPQHQLPAELLARILEYAIDPASTREDFKRNQRMLHSFTRVSKAWYRAAVRLAFRALLVTRGYQLRSLGDSFVCNPLLAQSVLKLTISIENAEVEMGRKRSAAWRGAAMRDVIGACVNMRDLEIQLVDGKKRAGGVVWEDVFPVLPLLSKLQRFTINADVSFADLSLCIADWRHLRNLEIHGTLSSRKPGCCGTPADALPTRTPSSRISSLVLRRTDLAHPQLRWLLAGRTVNELAHLDLGCLPDASLLPRDELQGTLMELASQLRSLRVVESRHLVTTDGWIEPVIAKCTNVEVLDVGSTLGLSSLLFDSTIPLLPNLRRLTIHPGKPHGGTRAVCAALIQDGVFKSLQRLTVHGTVGNRRWDLQLREVCRRKNIQLR
jgi:hypothetical protein